MAVYGIDYDEFNTGNKQDMGYKSVHISYGNLDKEKVFNTGNFVKDWYDLVRFIIMELSETESHFVGSSSVDHFFMDGAKFDEAYLITDENEMSVLKYDGYHEDGIVFYVPEGTPPTWEELKEMCK
jgi:hypothetical protein